MRKTDLPLAKNWTESVQVILLSHLTKKSTITAIEFECRYPVFIIDR